MATPRAASAPEVSSAETTLRNDARSSSPGRVHARRRQADRRSTSPIEIGRRRPEAAGADVDRNDVDLRLRSQ